MLPGLVGKWIFFSQSTRDPPLWAGLMRAYPYLSTGWKHPKNSKKTGFSPGKENRKIPCWNPPLSSSVITPFACESSGFTGVLSTLRFKYVILFLVTNMSTFFHHEQWDFCYSPSTTILDTVKSGEQLHQGWTFRISRATASIWYVWGNRSTGWISLISYSPCISSRSLARVAGLQDT